MECLPDCVAFESAAKLLMPHHPDSHELDDWPEYGPKNPAIANLVRALAYDRGMRVTEIERIIERALRDELTKGQGDGNSTDPTPNLGQM